MLTITLEYGESFYADGPCLITAGRIVKNQIRISIDAPPSTRILRTEIMDSDEGEAAQNYRKLPNNERIDIQATRGYDRSDEIRLAERLKKIAAILETVVCTDGCDSGVVMLSSDGPTHPETLENGKTVQVYDHEYFSPLGDALIAAWKIAVGKETRNGIPHQL